MSFLRLLFSITYFNLYYVISSEPPRSTSPDIIFVGESPPTTRVPPSPTMTPPTPTQNPRFRFASANHTAAVPRLVKTLHMLDGQVHSACLSILCVFVHLSINFFFCSSVYQLSLVCPSFVPMSTHCSSFHLYNNCFIHFFFLFLNLSISIHFIPFFAWIVSTVKHSLSKHI